MRPLQEFDDAMVGFFQEAGYAYATLTKRKEFEDIIQARRLGDGVVFHRLQIQRVYEQVRADPAFLVKVEGLRLSDASTHKLRKAGNNELFLFYIGFDDALPEVCERLSSEVYSEHVSGVFFFLRNRCLGHVAVQRHDPSLCERIHSMTAAVVASGLPGNWYVNPGPSVRLDGWSFDQSLPDWCRKDSRSSYVSPFPIKILDFFPKSYAETFSVVVEEMLPKLGVEIPKPPAARPVEIKLAEVYSLFYEYIVYQAPEKEREEFKRRLLNLK